MIRSSFAGFTTGVFGLSAAQKGLDVTGHNISNINTKGYTRQTLDQVSLHYGTSTGDHYRSTYDTRIGYGAMVTGISQIRDPYLDVRFRTEIPIAGEQSAKLSSLSELEGLLDEVNKAGSITNQLSDLVSKLNDYANHTGNLEHGNMVRNSAELLLTYFGNYARGIETSRTDLEDSFETVDITAVNKYLKEIQNLNDSIERSEMFGGTTLELRDERNLLIDELAATMKIKVKETKVEVATGTFVNRLHIDFIDGNGDPISLINGPDEAAQLKGSVAAGTSASLEIRPSYDGTLANKVNELLTNIQNTNTALQAAETAATPDPALITKLKDQQDNYITALKAKMPNTTIDVTNAGSSGVKIDIKDTNGSTISLIDGTNAAAHLKFDTTSNAPQVSLTVTPGSGGNPVPLVGPPSSGVTDITDKIASGTLKGVLDMLNGTGEFAVTGKNDFHGYGYYTKMIDTLVRDFAEAMNEANTDATDPTSIKGGPLFIIKDTPPTPGPDGKIPSSYYDNMTAKNIVINPDWTSGTVKLLDSRIADNKNDNIMSMISVIESKRQFQIGGTNGTGGTTFNGNFSELYVNMGNTLGLDIKSTKSALDNAAYIVNNINDSRDAMSAVSLDEEGMNLLKYQKCYNAAARFITTLDQALETIINNMGVVGR